MKRLLSIVTLCVLTLATSAVFQSVQADMVKVPTLNIRAISQDSDIDNQSTYVMAVNFWNQRGGEVINVNGVDFTTVANTNTYTANGVTMTYGGNTSGNILYHGGNGSNVGTGNIATVMTGMIFNDGQAANGTVDMTFTGLTPGKDYTYTVYGRVWGGNDNRRHSYSFFSSGNDTPDQFVKTYDAQNTLVTGYAMSEDNPVAYWPSLNNGTPYLVEYTFTAPENGKFKVRDLGTESGNSWHLYGISLKQATLGQTDVPVSTDIVKNGGFEIDTFVSTADKHGYVSKNFPLTNWTSNNPGRVGLAPDWSDYNRTAQTCKDFINATQATDAYLPEGSEQALYLQMEGGVSQNITLEPNTDYVLSYYTSSRTGTKDPKFSVDVDGSNVYTGILRVNQFDKNKFTYNAIPFTSQAGDSSYETTLAFTGLLYSEADGSQDRSLILDKRTVLPHPLGPARTKTLLSGFSLSKASVI